MANKVLNLGIIGLSPENGHPYSWSAILNGYCADAMKECPFPVIPEYLSKQSFPRDAIGGARVTHIWCDDVEAAESVSKAALIPNIVAEFEDMVGSVDAILLARDDAPNHYQFSKPFLDKGMPIYIDKPLGYSVKAAQALLDAQQYEGQIFSCSALRFDPDMLVTDEQLAAIGVIKSVKAYAPKSWERYAIHVLDPLCASLLAKSQIEFVDFARDDDEISAVYQIDGQYSLGVTVDERKALPIKIIIEGERGRIILKHADSFRAFKNALKQFIDVIRGIEPPPTPDELLAPIQMIGINYGRNSK